ncbi:hypothetical protein L208DRAFT_1392692 [Tricholoma matsutake]|nr:hypothetical protein L208DRAFT_1392686 [Tricholoma matsutake 945]KAF8235358.1 hypothetical protein L208DRAFT_1392692 [Tricholoma matsutake 945]
MDTTPTPSANVVDTERKALLDKTDELLAGFSDVKKRLEDQEKESNEKTEKMETLILNKARRQLQRRPILSFWKRKPDESMLYDESFQRMLLSRKERGFCDNDLLYHPTMRRLLLERGYDVYKP